MGKLIKRHLIWPYGHMAIMPYAILRDIRDYEPASQSAAPLLSHIRVAEKSKMARSCVHTSRIRRPDYHACEYPRVRIYYCIRYSIYYTVHCTVYYTVYCLL